MANGVPFIIDNYYLTITFLISLAIQLSAFVVAYTLQFDKITDFSGGTNFLINALITILLHFSWSPSSFYSRNVIASVFQIVWAARLGGFLLYRVLKTGSDTRFDEMRSKFWNFAGFWTFQLVWVWTVSLPVTILNSPNASAPQFGAGNPTFGSGTDIVGIILFAIGLGIEAVGDQQKFNFKSQKPPKTAINDKGVWSWTRHPNYCGEIFLWWGMWLLVLQPARSHVVNSHARAALYGSVVSPVFITRKFFFTFRTSSKSAVLLLFVSGMPTAEKPVQQRYYLMENGPKKEQGQPWQDYKAYCNRTSVLVPLPPTLYVRLPTFVKRYVLLDLPMFQFNAEKDGQKAIDEQQKKQDA